MSVGEAGRRSKGWKMPMLSNVVAEAAVEREPV